MSKTIQQHSGKQLLIVEDDEVFSAMLSKALTKKGFNVSCTNSIATATQAAKSNPPNYAVVDLRLDNESGLQVIPILKNINTHINIIVLTGYASIVTAVEAIKLGAVHYLTKPAGSDEIYQALFKKDGNTKQTLENNPLSVKRLEWEHIQKVLNENNGNLSATARSLNMHRRTLQRKLNKRPTNI